MSDHQTAFNTLALKLETSLFTVRDRLLYWIKAVNRQAPKARVLIIGTHRAGLTKSQVDAKIEAVRACLGDMKTKAEIMAVESDPAAVGLGTESQQELDEAGGISAVRDKIVEMAKALPGMGEKYPVIYLHMLAQIRHLVLKEQRGVVTRGEFDTLAREHCNITDLQEVEDMLALFHDTGEVLYFGDKQVLRTLVMLHPGCLLEVAAELTSTEMITECLARVAEDTAQHRAWTVLLERGQVQRVLLAEGSLLWESHVSAFNRMNWLQAMGEVDVCFMPAAVDGSAMDDTDVVAWVPCRLPVGQLHTKSALSHQWALRCHKFQVSDSHLQGTHYETLGVRWRAPRRDVELAYRRKTRQFHPDKISSAEWDEICKVRWHALQVAFECLSDTDKRKRYDKDIQKSAQSTHDREYLLPQSLFHSLLIGICALIPAEDIATLHLAKGFIQAVLPHNRHQFCVEFIEAKQLVSFSLFLELDCTERMCRSSRAELRSMLGSAWPSSMDRFGVSWSMFVPCESEMLLNKVDWQTQEMAELKPGWELSGRLLSVDGHDVWDLLHRLWGEHFGHVQGISGKCVIAPDRLSALWLPPGADQSVALCRSESALTATPLRLQSTASDSKNPAAIGYEEQMPLAVVSEGKVVAPAKCSPVVALLQSQSAALPPNTKLVVRHSSASKAGLRFFKQPSEGSGSESWQVVEGALRSHLRSCINLIIKLVHPVLVCSALTLSSLLVHRSVTLISV